MFELLTWKQLLFSFVFFFFRIFFLLYTMHSVAFAAFERIKRIIFCAYSKLMYFGVKVFLIQCYLFLLILTRVDRDIWRMINKFLIFSKILYICTILLRITFTGVMIPRTRFLSGLLLIVLSPRTFWMFINYSEIVISVLKFYVCTICIRC